MSTERNKETVRRLFEAINSGRMDRLSEFVTPGYVHHAPRQRGDIEGAADALEMARATFDVYFAIEDMIAEGDRLAVRFRITGMHSRHFFMDIPPTGKPVMYTGIFIFRFEGERIAEAWLNMDTLGLLQQVGVFPASVQLPG